MGRKPTKNLNLPKRMRARQKAGGIYFYYDTGGKPRHEIPLGPDYVEAVRRWAELEISSAKIASIITFKDLSDRYTRDVIPTKAERTQRDNLKELANLLSFFKSAPIDAIRPTHIRQYLDWRGQQAKVRANREKALFSHIWNKAREWGITDLSNPCEGVKGFKEAGRDIYIEDEVLEAVWKEADIPMREALDLAYLTGQRPSDVLSMKVTDIRDGMLMVKQKKTEARLRIEVSGELEALIARIEERKKSFRIHTLALVCNENGKPLSSGALRSRFEKAREKAANENPKINTEILAFQYRDLRAKAGTDKNEYGDMRDAQLLLGHTSVKMTEHYIRSRKGEKISPTK